MARAFARASSQYAEFTGTSPLGAGALTQFTLAGWYKPSSIANGSMLSVGSAAGNGSYIALGMDPSGNAFMEVAAASSPVTPTGPVLTNGAWAHVAGVQVSATSRTVYRNGAAGTANTTSKSPTGLDVVTIGGLMIGTRVSFAGGDIGECAIWNVGLSAAEILALSRGVSPLRVRPGNLVFYVPSWGTSSPERDYTAGQRHAALGATTAAPTQATSHPRVAPIIGGSLWTPPASTGGATDYTKAIDDAATITDAVSKAPGLAIADGLQVTDGGMAFDTAYLIADAATVTDQAATAWAAVRTISDAATFTDSIDTGGSTARTLNVDDAITVGDTQARDYGRALTDEATAADALAKDVGHQVDDAATASDQPSTAWGAARTINDVGELSDVPGTAWGAVRGIDDAGTLSDLVSNGAAFAHVKQIDDTLTVAGVLAPAWDATLALDDTLTAGDVPARAWAASRNLADSLTVAEHIDGIPAEPDLSGYTYSLDDTTPYSYGLR